DRRKARPVVPLHDEPRTPAADGFDEIGRERAVELDGPPQVATGSRVGEAGSGSGEAIRSSSGSSRGIGSSSGSISYCRCGRPISIQGQLPVASGTETPIAADASV